MGHYRSHVRDIEFVLFELLGRGEVLGSGPFDEIDRDTAREMLREAERMASGPLAEAFADGAHGKAVFDARAHSVTLPPTFVDAYHAYTRAEWWRMDIDAGLGGIAAPPSLRWAVAELALGANPAAFIYAAGWTHADVLYRLGTPEQQQLAQLMVDRHWGATMVLTEPDAGSSVGSGRTRAVPQPDGTWHLEGVKRFITSADHDLAENIVHFVLARPVDTPGAGGPGTKGLSMFAVPKHLVDLETGELGERNGVLVTNVEKKMGLSVSATCELTFGSDAPAVGYLVGEVHQGIAQMFEVVEYARMLVGVKAMATLSTGYLNALDYARTRLQGPDIALRADKSAPDIAIVGHPDVRRSLMLQKSYAEGLRALTLFAASLQDERRRDQAAGGDGAAAKALNDLLLPIVKGFSSERAYELLAESLQVFGGSGYLQDYPIEQYIRDAKIDTVYEGTTAIQGLDLFYRKIARDQGATLATLTKLVAEQCASSPVESAPELAGLRDALDAVEETVALMLAWNVDAASDPAAARKIGLNATRLLMMLGELTVGWLLAWEAAVARDALAAGVRPEDEGFYWGKIEAARYFAQVRLPLVATEAAICRSTTVDLAEMPADWF